MQKSKKFNRYGISQDRIFVLSNLSIYLFSNRKLHTKYNVTDLRYIIKSMHSKEFILQFDDTGDLRLTLEDREDLVNLVKMRFANLQPKK